MVGLVFADCRLHSCFMMAARLARYVCLLWFVLHITDACLSSGSSSASSSELSAEQKEELMVYARATWESMKSLTFSNGLTSDRMDDDDDDPVSQTSVTNIACYMWSVIVARDLKIISGQDAIDRLTTTLKTLATMERYSGHFINWYNARTSKGGDEKFVSSVDSGWLAAGLILVKNAVPEVSRRAKKLLDTMDFGWFLDTPTGCLSTGFYPLENKTSGNSYCTLNTETRIAAYIGIGRSQLKPTLYFKLLRTEPADCEEDWAEMRPEGVTKTYMGIDVFEGHFTYRKMKIVPSWGGSMFEALMVPLIVPEVEWGPKNWGINHPLYARAQIEHGLQEAEYGVWGFSPAYNPSGGYMEYGVDSIGTSPNGYYSNNDKTGVDYGYPGCGRDPKPIPPPSAYTNGVVTPHATFLALAFDPKRTMDALQLLKDKYKMFGKYGFYDSINVQTGQIAKKQLSLDQGMIMAAIGNALSDKCLQKYFAAESTMVKAIKPLLEMEEFTSGIAD